jgi:5-methylcytosine-specific restriction enzyme subunit McrC
MSQSKEQIRNTYYLFEYGDSIKLEWKKEKILRFQVFLEEMWENRTHSGILSQWYTAEEEPISQPILQFIHRRKGKDEFGFYIRASNYVGIIRFEEDVFHLIPKLFKGEEKREALKKSNAHLLWWLSYNKWLNLPKHVTNLSHQKCDFLEILIHLFSSYTIDQLNIGPFQAYQEMEDETTYLKGQLMFNEYVSNYLGRANYQKMYCRYDSFEIDNTFNRIIKYVCKQLIQQTRLRQTRNNLSNILRILDEVSDVPASIYTCDEVVLNRMFGGYQLVLDYCRMFLANSQSTSNDQHSDVFAFLVPMEKVFEEFVHGFIQKELKDKIEITGQVRGTYLTTSKKFALRPDLKLEAGEFKFIADTKYKLLHDGFKGMSSSDLYQMLTYAVRFNVDRVMLFYPSWSGMQDSSVGEYDIKDELAGAIVKIEFHSLEILSENQQHDENISIQRLFEPCKMQLKEQISDLFEDATLPY